MIELKTIFNYNVSYIRNLLIYSGLYRNEFEVGVNNYGK